MFPGTQVKTARLVLRPPVAADVDALVTQLGDLAVARWLAPVPHPYDAAQAARFVARVRDEGLPVLAIDAGAGLIGLVETGPRLGYWLGRAHWGRGFGHEAARAARDHAFAVMGEAEMRSGYFLGNAASARILARLGFRPTEVTRETCRARGETFDHQNLVLTRAEWEAHDG